MMQRRESEPPTSLPQCGSPWRPINLDKNGGEDYDLFSGDLRHDNNLFSGEVAEAVGEARRWRWHETS